jgi:hypothetical protein
MSNQSQKEKKNSSHVDLFLAFLLLFCAGMEFELKTSVLANLGIYCLSHASSPFCSLDVLEIGPCELFACTGFESPFSHSQPPKELGLWV